MEITLYGSGDWMPPEIPGVTYHASSDGQLGRYWVVAFDGGDGGQPCGLVAREGSDGYTGFWTDDAAMVERIRQRLQRAATDQSDSEADPAHR